jgi:hypothetical protein
MNKLKKILKLLTHTFTVSVAIGALVSLLSAYFKLSPSWFALMLLCGVLACFCYAYFKGDL